jgi:3'-5' exoribonuclease 1
MKYIVYDLEATCWEAWEESRKIQEVIEIGAVKVNEYGEAEDSFCRFIRPVLHPSLSMFCRTLTTIRQEDINRAGNFAEVSEAFLDWILGDDGDDEYVLCSWGGFDKKALLRDCDLHRLDADWCEPHINLKEQYQRIRRLNKSIGLKKAIDKEGFEWTGTQHRGINDAYNLAKIFAKFLGDWRL